MHGATIKITFLLSYKTHQLMLYTGKIVLCSKVHTKHRNIIYGQRVEFLNGKPGDTQSYRLALEA